MLTYGGAWQLKRKFSFFSTDDKAEVQLGGYDPATADGTMWYTPALASDDFIVGVTSLKFGDNLVLSLPDLLVQKYKY